MWDAMLCHSLVKKECQNFSKACAAAEILLFACKFAIEKEDSRASVLPIYGNESKTNLGKYIKDFLKKISRDIGAQNTLKKKQKNDDVAIEYIRLYMRFKMALRRHPEDAALKNRFNDLSYNMKLLREKRDAGDISSDDILEWLASQENT